MVSATVKDGTAIAKKAMKSTNFIASEMEIALPEGISVKMKKNSATTVSLGAWNILQVALRDSRVIVLYQQDGIPSSVST